MKFEKLDDTKIKIILTIKDLELYTGKLTFHAKMNMRTITVNTLDFTDTIRMKIINLDTVVDKYKAICDESKIEESRDNNDNNENNKNSDNSSNKDVANSAKNDNSYKEFKKVEKILLEEIIDFMKYENFDINSLNKYLKKYTVNSEYICNIIKSNYN